MFNSCSRTCGALLFLTAAVAGCSTEPTSRETPAPGEAARVVLTVITFAGGREVREETRIDSASGRYTYSVCNDAPITASCTALRPVRTGDALPVTLRELFEAPGRGAFRTLRDAYSDPPGVTPPDGGSARLEIVRNGTRRIITWQSRAFLPIALTEYLCAVQSARGDLLLCD